MQPTTLKKFFPAYFSFLSELDMLLKEMRISYRSLPVTSEINHEKNWQLPSDEIVKIKMGKVILYIEEHLSEELSLTTLAEEIELSKYQLIRGFQKEKGTTPWKFLIKKRIEHVKELLENGAAPCQAAVESGFYDQSHMNKTFREATGQTPKEYQEENFRNRN